MSLLLKSAGAPEGLKVLQYPFPVKAVQGKLKVNGEEVRAAQTAGRGKSYTYFTVNGVDYYVSGTVAFDTEHTIDFPGGYAAKTLKVTRAVVKKGPKKSKAEAPATEGVTAEAAPADVAVPPPFTGGKKAKRGEAAAAQA